MPALDFSKYNALSFDCYGTLIDWETGIKAELGPWAEKIRLNDNELLSSFAQVESRVQTETPELAYPQVLGEAMRRIGQARGVKVEDAEAEKFGGSVGRWPAFPDSIPALAELKKRFKLVILSNIDRASFAKSNEVLGAEFDLIVTAQDVGSYKPNRDNFLALFDQLGTIGADRSTLLHVAQSLFHDHEPALALGLETVWIDRRHDEGGFGATPPPSTEVSPTWTFPSMKAFAVAAD